MAVTTGSVSTSDDAFERIYAGVSSAKVEQLRAFRASHPYKSLTLGGVEWQYIASGKGRQALLVLGGGISTGESSFERILKMEGRYRVISPSYPAVGRMDAVCDGLAAILDAEGIKKAHILGHSLGAGIAHSFVRLYPQKVERLILSGFGLYNARNLSRAKFALWVFRVMPYRFVSGYYKNVMARLVKDAPDQDEAVFMAAYARDLLDHQHTKASFMGQFALLEDVFVNAEKYHLREPVDLGERVLILQAKDDTGFAPDEQVDLRATYPGAVVHLFEGGGHLAGVTRRDEYEAAIEAFLKA